MSKLKITFIIPCFNSANFMEKCLDSLTNQTLSDIEFIFIDDGSTDDTKAIIQSFIKLEPRARLISQSNQGITAARLTGLNNTNSDYVSFIDADDYIDLEVAQEAHNIFLSDKSIDALLYNFVYQKGNKYNLFKLKFNFPLDGFDIISNTIPSWKIYTNGIYKTTYALEAYNKINFKSTNSDEVANRLIFEKCKKVEIIKSSYYYVQYPSSTSKYPSKNYINRLTSAYWLRNYAHKNWVGRVSYDKADMHFINEICSLSLQYTSAKDSMPIEVKSEWHAYLFKYRKKALRLLMLAFFKYPVKIITSYKSIRKFLYILTMPFIIKI